ncbi:MAG: hypothetical protein AAFQ57_13260 [Cyanobacteria bacterium J06626_14]
MIQAMSFGDRPLMRHSGSTTTLDWRTAAHAATECFFTRLLLCWHGQEVYRLRDLIQAESTFDISFLEVT